MLSGVRSSHLVTACLLILPAYLIQDDLYIRIIQVACFFVLAKLAGKRVRITYFAILTVSVTLFELFVPWGKVLISVGRWQITQGALLRGIDKGLTVSGMVFISLAAVRRDLRFPGRVGAALGETLYRFEGIFEYRGKIDRRRFLSSLDELLFEQFDPSSLEKSRTINAPTPVRPPIRIGEYAAVFLFVALNWSALFIPIFEPR